jgi:hypothetical protein
MNLPLSRRTLLAAATAFTTALLIAPLGACGAAGLARVDVYDRGANTALTEYRYRGQRFIAGEPGNEYAVRVRNCSQQRVLAVVSVDGVNVVSGESAAPDQNGYVIEPGGYVTIQGWRKDLDRTAAFYFSDPGDSYAARTGRPKDLGVIGVALFRERAVAASGAINEDWKNRGPAGSNEAGASRQAKSNGTADAAAPAASQRAYEATLGTGHGRGEYSPVQRVEFERASAQPDEVVAIRYERRERLVALGVIPAWRSGYAYQRPDPFPAAVGFVPDP